VGGRPPTGARRKTTSRVDTGPKCGQPRPACALKCARASAWLKHDAMLSLFQPSQIAATTSDAMSTVPLSVVREVFQEIAAERQRNLAFRQAVSDHEAANVPKVAPAQTGRVASGKSGGGRGSGGGGRSNKSDLRLKPPKMSTVPSVPRSLANQIVFDTCTIRTTVSNSTSTISESNFAVSLSTNPQSASWAALFDQWCVPQFSVTWMSIEPPSFTGTTPELHTAIDFDNSVNLGSLAAIDDYGTARTDVLIFNKSVTRSVRPCVKPDASGTSGALTARSWIDCAQPGILHYGIRSIIGQASTAATTLVVDTTVWYAFRNTI
jgi:hypothetical protein